MSWYFQKLLFFDTAEGVSTTLRPYWAEAIMGRAEVVQAQPDMLEIVPAGTSKGNGVKMLLNHLGISEKEVQNSFHFYRFFFLDTNRLDMLKIILD